MDEHRYIIPTSDWGFKRLFATEENKGLLIGLLNKIIEGPEILDLEYLDREVLLPLKGKYGTVRFDVYCLRADGSRIIVEMQKHASSKFIDRALVYTAASILDGFIVNEHGVYEVQSTYLIAITGDNIFPQLDQAPVRIAMCGINIPERPVLSDKVLQIFIELPKFAEKAEALSPEDDFLSKFAVAMKTMGTSDDRPEVMDDQLLVDLYEAADLRFYQELDKEEYENQLMNNIEYEATLYDYREMGFADGKAEGLAEGIAEGEAKGKAETLKETAGKLKAQGVPLETIAICTGLDKEFIESL